MEPSNQAPTVVRLVSAMLSFVVAVLFMNLVMRHVALFLHGSTEYNDNEYLLVSGFYFAVYFLGFAYASTVERDLQDKPTRDHLRLIAMTAAVGFFSYLF
jgi:hypothetical protein